MSEDNIMKGAFEKVVTDIESLVGAFLKAMESKPELCNNPITVLTAVKCFQQFVYVSYKKILSSSQYTTADVISSFISSQLKDISTDIINKLPMPPSKKSNTKEEQ